VRYGNHLGVASTSKERDNLFARISAASRYL
jgi:hypothetical protein